MKMLIMKIMLTDDDASGTNSNSELEMAVYTVSDEIKNADLSSGLVQLNGDNHAGGRIYKDI